MKKLGVMAVQLYMPLVAKAEMERNQHQRDGTECTLEVAELARVPWVRKNILTLSFLIYWVGTQGPESQVSGKMSDW